MVHTAETEIGTFLAPACVMPCCTMETYPNSQNNKVECQMSGTPTKLLTTYSVARNNGVAMGKAQRAEP